MVVNIHFNNLNASNISELYLYQRLRWYAKDHGGSIKGFNFSKTELYNILPKLTKRGWVSKDKIVKHRTLLNRYNCSNYSSRLTDYDLSSIDNFKAFVLSTCESYILFNRSSKKNKIREAKSGYNCWVQKKGIGYFSNSEYFIENNFNSDIANSVLSKILNISLSSVSRWRKISNALNYSEYTVKANVYSRYPVASRVVRGSLDESSVMNKITVLSAGNSTPKPGFNSKMYGGLVRYSISTKPNTVSFRTKRRYYNGFKGLQ